MFHEGIGAHPYSFEQNRPDSYLHEVSGKDACIRKLYGLDAYCQEETYPDPYIYQGTGLRP